MSKVLFLVAILFLSRTTLAKNHHSCALPGVKSGNVYVENLAKNEGTGFTLCVFSAKQKLNCLTEPKKFFHEGPDVKVDCKGDKITLFSQKGNYASLHTLEWNKEKIKLVSTEEHDIAADIRDVEINN